MEYAFSNKYDNEAFKQARYLYYKSGDDYNCDLAGMLDNLTGYDGYDIYRAKKELSKYTDIPQVQELANRINDLCNKIQGRRYGVNDLTGDPEYITINADGKVGGDVLWADNLIIRVKNGEPEIIGLCTGYDMDSNYYWDYDESADCFNFNSSLYDDVLVRK